MLYKSAVEDFQNASANLGKLTAAKSNLQNTISAEQNALEEAQNGQAVKDAQNKVNATRDQIDKLSDAVAAEQSNNQSIKDKTDHILSQNAAERAQLEQQVGKPSADFNQVKDKL